MKSVPEPDRGHAVVTDGELLADRLGVAVYRLFPSVNQSSVDPFLLLDDLRMEQAGFPMHAHSGFEKITLVLDGSLRHTDELGTDLVARSGDIHLLRANAGISHAEWPADSTCRAIQMWFDIPDAWKEARPDVAWCARDRVPVSREAWGLVRHIAGRRGALKTQSSIEVREFKYTDSGTCVLEAADVHLLYVLAGHVIIAGQTAVVGQLAVVRGSGSNVMDAGEGSHILHLSGNPLGRHATLWGGHVD